MNANPGTMRTEAHPRAMETHPGAVERTHHRAVEDHPRAMTHTGAMEAHHRAVKAQLAMDMQHGCGHRSLTGH